ncbi:MAG TPA: 6-carboxytetrahydropterin synthase [Opitutaceae bacterium]|nr:6-carboxytetrahydropterin synthase [Opitutaceae bacterium]
MHTDQSKPVSAGITSRSLNGIVYITRRAHFNAAHRLHNPDFSQEWNTQQFGLCNNPRWHGHNYMIEVTVKGRPHPETGYVIDIAELKKVINEAVIDPCDHRNLNEEVEFLKGILPSTENLVVAFWKQIEPRITSGKLHSVRLYETERNYAEFLGET